MSGSFHLTRADAHFGWSRDHPPLLSVPSGAEISFEIQDASAGQITPSSGHEDLGAMDFSKVNPVTGPVYVEGAMPGDVLQVDILSIEPSPWGWTGQIPGFGLLSEEYPDPWLQTWSVGSTKAVSNSGLEVPVRPMCGVLGVAPAEPGSHSVVPPRNVGGNLDIRQLGVGSTLYLPVEVEGALFGAGDTHAAQGDGEVCGTGIESPMTVALRLSVRRDLKVSSPQFDWPGEEDRPHTSGAGYFATTGVEPDLMEASKQAVRSMITALTNRYGVSDREAYGLCSVAVDLRISEVVDAPNWVVSAFFPLDVVIPTQ